MRPAAVGLVLFPWVPAIVLVAWRVLAKRRTHWLAYSFGALLPWLPLLPVVLPSVVEHLGRRDFSSVEWKAAAAVAGRRGPSNARIKMVDDLIASGALNHRTRAEVEGLLGPDDGRGGTGYGVGYFSEWDAVYWLGPERGFLSIDSEWLVLRFGADGRVGRYRLVRD